VSLLIPGETNRAAAGNEFRALLPKLRAAGVSGRMIDYAVAAITLENSAKLA
jgi:hypothetical protein